MLEYTKAEPPIEIRATGDNMLHGTAQGILLVVVRGTDKVLRKVKLPVVLVPGLRRNIFPVQEQLKSGSFSIQLTRLDNIDHFESTIAKENRKTESVFCAFSGKTFGKDSVLTVLRPKKPVAL